MSQELVTVVFKNRKRVEIPRSNLGKIKRIHAGQIDYIDENEDEPIIARPIVEVVEDNSNPTPDDTTASMSNSKSELTEIAKIIDGYNPKMNKQQLVDLING